MESGQHQDFSEDVTARRMKNRERQRRYRARKRLEADSTSTTLPTPEEAIMDLEPIAVVHRDWVPRVHSKRDWKKDARKVISSSTTDTQSSSSGLISGPKSETPVESESVDHGAPVGRRDWKAEARTRKS